MTYDAASESEIFKVVVGLPAEQRSAYLDQACGGDQRLRADLESLLAADARDGGFLDGPAAATMDCPIAERPGTTIGPYKLLQQIGEGGMGVVFMAEQERPVRRRVALKIIKPGMDSRQVIARFEAERQALAMMEHQNIARVLDAGTTDSGRPYFVMELVHGVPLTTFCEEGRLTLRRRLELFIPVCQAIQHAHQKGIVHRDIKPGNVLVTMYDDQPVPKVIDFGVAKAVEQRLTEKTLFTHYGMLVGTPEYMSPEQAEMNAFGVDTRSDVYSLGVLLYELLTGTTPLERSKFREAALVEMVRLIREEEPPRPSVRLTASGSLPKFAAACRTEPSQLPKLISGELDWIVMRCLEKDRARRYETVNGLARDIQRYLHDEPVEACPPSPFYRLRKTARRHRALLTVLACFTALLAIAGVVGTGLGVHAVRAQRRAETALEGERRALAEAVAARQTADRASQRLREATQLANEGIAFYQRSNWAAAQDRFTKAVAVEPDLETPYLYRANLHVALGLWDRAASDFDRRFRLAKSVDAQACYENALLQLYVGDETRYREACAELVRRHGRSAANKTRYDVAKCRLLDPRPVGDPQELLRQADALATGARSPWNLALAGVASLRAGDFEQAVVRSREAIQLGSGSPAGVHRVAYAPLALALHGQGKGDEAEAALTQAEQARNQWIQSMFDGLADAMPIDWKTWLEFEVFYREAHRLVRGTPPTADDRLVAVRRRSEAAVSRGDVFAWMDAGREQVELQAWDSAATAFIKVLDELPAEFVQSPQIMALWVEMVRQPEVFAALIKQRPDDRRIWLARGRLDASEGRWSAAASAYVKSSELLETDLGRLRRESEIETVRGRNAPTTTELAALWLLSEKKPAFHELHAAVVRRNAEPTDAFAAASWSRVCTLSAEGVEDWSVPLRLAEYAVREQPRVPWYQCALGIALCRAGRHEEAVQSSRTSLDLMPDWVGRGQNHVVLALACHRLGRRAEALKWLAQARSSLNAMNRTMANNRFGFAGSYYLGDWLCLNVLLNEAEQTIDAPAKATPNKAE
jgi:serine/threonine protein kinase/tetratricopeptide (TPR) repeat protein